MGTATRYPRQMPRSPFTPSKAQAELLAALRHAAEERDAAEARYRQILAACEEAGIPITRLADELGVQRKTVYRHLGQQMK